MKGLKKICAAGLLLLTAGLFIWNSDLCVWDQIKLQTGKGVELPVWSNISQPLAERGIAHLPSIVELPRTYDYRSVGRTPAIRDQGNQGTCWAFASLTALESTLMPEEVLEFGPDHMLLNNGFTTAMPNGGEYTMSMAYLLSWKGPVLEIQDPYGDGFSPSGLKPVKHVQEIRILQAKDYDAIKKAVLRNGGVQSSFYTSLTSDESQSVYYNEEKSAYCYIGTEAPNHDCVIIGWDDDYPKENFSIDVKGDGAFICANSWGENFGEDGYFYLSYYDSNIGVYNILYSGVYDTDQFDYIYQTDLRGWSGQVGYGEETAYCANVYQADTHQKLEAVGFYATAPDTEYQVYVVPKADGSSSFQKKELVAEGKLKDAGYYTIPVDGIHTELEQSQRFAVIAKITTPGAIHPIAAEYESDSDLIQVDITDGEGYISLDGTIWERTEETLNCNVCLKVYTTKWGKD